MVARGGLGRSLVTPPVPLAARLRRRLGFTEPGIGLALIALIIYSVVFAYR